MGQAEGIERGVIVVVSPRFGHIVLDAGIEKGCDGKDEKQGCGIGREDVAKEEDVGTFAAERLPKQCHERKGEEDGKGSQMGVAEDVDGAGDGVVGHYARKEVALVRPAHRKLVASEFHPNAIHGILWDDERLGHYQRVATINAGLLA